MSTHSPTDGDHNRPSRLPRRQSYDPLSSHKGDTSTHLSLGNLPAPQFGALPAGQRSVPAVESKLFPGGPFKMTPSSSTGNDGQLTPGGSLVIGAEVFGLGSTNPKQATSSLKDAWASPDPSALSKDSGASSVWPLDLKPSTAVDRPSLKSFGSSVDLRPSGLTAPSEPGIPQRPVANRSKTSVALETSSYTDNSPFASPSSRPSIPTSLQQSMLREITSPPFPQPTGPFTNGSSALDDLSNGLRNATIHEEPSTPAQRNGASRTNGSAFSYGGGDQFPSYDPSYFAAPGVDMFGNRRDSGYGSTPGMYGDNRGAMNGAQQAFRRSPPTWNVPPAAYGVQGEYQVPSAPSSRQGSFSYASTPYAGYPLNPSSMYGSPVEGGSPVFAAAGLAPRGGRVPVDYIAPGPAPHMPPYGPWAVMPDVARMMRSPLLEDFRSNRHRQWELSDLLGHIVEFAGDQLGSRHIQQKLETATPEEKQAVFDEILPNILQLSTDVFANYVVQKFFEQGSQAQKAAMAKMLEGHVLQLSLQMYGCRVIQKAIEHVLVEQQVRIVKELDGHVLRCSRDAQANHVVQRALERVPPEHLNFITDACLGQVHALATHPYGCRVLQRIFENCPPAQSRELLDELQRFSHNLIQDQYGNYVIQWVIEKGNPADRSLVISKTYGQMLPLSQQKFSSNVMEKCIQYGTEDERHRLIEEIMQTLSDGSTVVKAMLTHPYANYVMQKILNYVQGDQRQQLFQLTAIELNNLRKYSTTYSKHLLAIEKLLNTERAGRPF